jgi:hypothetical protein
MALIAVEGSIFVQKASSHMKIKHEMCLNLYILGYNAVIGRVYPDVSRERTTLEMQKTSQPRTYHHIPEKLAP